MPSSKLLCVLLCTSSRTMGSLEKNLCKEHTLYKASSAPSKALGSLLSRHCTMDMSSSGHVGSPPTPTITATFVPTTCLSGLLGLRIACSSATCTGELSQESIARC